MWAFVNMKISMDIDGESADMDMDMDGQFNIHGKSVPIVPCVKRIACC